MRFGPVIGDDQHIRLRVGKLQEFADLAIDFLVVVVNRVLEFVTGLVESMRRVHVVPQGVMDAVGPHLDHDKVIPVVLREEMTRELEALPRHLVDVG